MLELSDPQLQLVPLVARDEPQLAGEVPRAAPDPFPGARRVAA